MNAQLFSRDYYFYHNKNIGWYQKAEKHTYKSSFTQRIWNCIYDYVVFDGLVQFANFFYF